MVAYVEAVFEKYSEFFEKHIWRPYSSYRKRIAKAKTLRDIEAILSDARYKFEHALRTIKRRFPDYFEDALGYVSDYYEDLFFLSIDRIRDIIFWTPDYLRLRRR